MGQGRARVSGSGLSLVRPAHRTGRVMFRFYIGAAIAGAGLILTVAAWLMGR